jgi:hypothetical protein
MEKMAVNVRRTLVVYGILVLAVSAAGCGGSSGGERPGTGGTTGTPQTSAGGGTTASGGTTATTGGTTATGGTTTAPATSAASTVLSCSPGVSPAAPLLTDFSSSGASGWRPTGGKWGLTDNLTGSIFSYGGGQAGSTMNAAVDTVGQDLVLSGNVLAGDYSGGGMSFDQCVNTSTYTGVQFTLGGSTAGCDLYFDVQTFDEQGTANKGGCTGSSCYAFPNEKLTSTAGTVTVHFSDLTGGVLTTQSAIRNEIVGLQWQFQSPAPVGDGGQPGCTGIALTIANVSFVSN